jgi:hypothetical protein
MIMKKHMLSVTINLALSILIVLFGCGGKEVAVGTPKEFEDVLDVIPADVVGFVYASSFQGLNDEINALCAELAPNNPPQEDLAMGLVDFFGAEFEMLQKLGFFDLSKNFAIFFTGVNPSVPSAAAYLKDPEMVQQLIETESMDRRSVTHNDMPYYITSDGAMFVPLGDFIVFSGSAEVCEKAIDTYRNAMPSIAKDVAYTSFELDRKSGINDLVGYVAMESVTPVIREWLTDFVDVMAIGMQDVGEMTPQLAPSLAITTKMVDGVNWVLDQADALSFTLQLNEGDLQISPVLKFKSDSEIQEYIHAAQVNLTQLKYLPQQAMVNGAMRLQKETLIKLGTGMMSFFSSSDAEADGGESEKATQEFTELTTKFYEPLGEEVAFSVEYSGSLMPNTLNIYDVTNEDKLVRFMDEDYLSYLATSNFMLRAMGFDEFSNIYAEASVGPSEIYNGVEIKHYSLPNIPSLFAQTSPEMEGLEGLVPKELNIYYAITNGKLIYAMSADAQPVRDALDRIAGIGIGFDNAAGYDKITGALTLKNNLLLAISPITAIKRTVELAAQIEPSAGMVMMFLGNMPETYSIGISGQGRAGGVEANLFISLVDFKVLVDMLTTFESSMQGMQ